MFKVMNSYEGSSISYVIKQFLKHFVPSAQLFISRPSDKDHTGSHEETSNREEHHEIAGLFFPGRECWLFFEQIGDLEI
jgi:hypothetical protein